jgi:mannose-6-phosphate isomerase-like protein (cupin superfamily)
MRRPDMEIPRDSRFPECRPSRGGALDSGSMSAFTIVNIMEVEGSAPDPDAERNAIFTRTKIDSEHVGVSYFRYGPNVRANMGHSHREQEEVYVVVSGSGRVKLNDEIHDLKQWDVVRVAPATVRAFEGGPNGMELVIAASDRPEGGDGVRVEDFWPSNS